MIIFITTESSSEMVISWGESGAIRNKTETGNDRSEYPGGKYENISLHLCGWGYRK